MNFEFTRIFSLPFELVLIMNPDRSGHFKPDVLGMCASRAARELSDNN